MCGLRGAVDDEEKLYSCNARRADGGSVHGRSMATLSMYWAEGVDDRHIGAHPAPSPTCGASGRTAAAASGLASLASRHPGSRKLPDRIHVNAFDRTLSSHLYEMEDMIRCPS